jgi:hypothetical protein
MKAQRKGVDFSGGRRGAVLQPAKGKREDLEDTLRRVLREMEDLAWVLRTDGRRGNIGFVQARELKPGLRHALSDDWD